MIAGLHVIQGDFVKAMEILRKQLAIVNFEPLKHLFGDMNTLSKVKIQTLPHGQPLSYQIRLDNQVPFSALNLNSLINKYSVGIELTTKGDFSGALDAFRVCLQSIPLMVLTQRNEIKEVQKMITDLNEYIYAMRLELERKNLVKVSLSSVTF